MPQDYERHFADREAREFPTGPNGPAAKSLPADLDGGLKELERIGTEADGADLVTVTVSRRALRAAYLAAEVDADDERGEDGPLTEFIRSMPDDLFGDEVDPRCDICGRLMEDSPAGFADVDWNPETGNHETCERGRV